jgi:hypothetical protein
VATPTSTSRSTLLHDLLRFTVLAFIGGLVAEQLGRDRAWLGLAVLVLSLAFGAGLLSSGLVARRDAVAAGAAPDQRRVATWRLTTGALCAVGTIGGYALSRLAFP